MNKVGNKENASLNGEWGKHVSKYWKRKTAKKRRAVGKKEIKKNK